MPTRLPLRHALALGLMHGPAELFPVSSSGHTILLPWLLDWPYAELDSELRKSFEVALHTGTSAALLVGARHRLAAEAHRLDGRQSLVLALSLVPPAAVGYKFEKLVQSRLSRPVTIAAGLLGGAVAMGIADVCGGASARRLEDAGVRDGLALGLAQACALLPGVSRSGAILTAARARGFARTDSRSLAWRTALPVILGASALKTWRLIQRGAVDGAGGALLMGAGAAFFSTLVSARVLRHLRQDRSLLGSVLYRCLISGVVIGRLRDSSAVGDGGAHN